MSAPLRRSVDHAPKVARTRVEHLEAELASERAENARLRGLLTSLRDATLDAASVSVSMASLLHSSLARIDAVQREVSASTAPTPQG